MDKTEQTASKPAAEKPPEESAQSAATIVRKRTAAGVEEAIPAKKRKTCRYKLENYSIIVAVLVTDS